MGELKHQLSALANVLRSLHDLAEHDDTICALLEAPLRQCCVACEDFRALLEDCRRNAKDGKPSFSEWMRLRYRNGDIVSFIESLGMYKSTIGIAVADANLWVWDYRRRVDSTNLLSRRTSRVTVSVLNEYKAAVDTTAQHLQAHFNELRDRVDGLTTPVRQSTPRSILVEQMVQEQGSIEDCLQICRRFQADLEQMRFQLASGDRSPDPASRLTTASNDGITLAKTITLSSLQACGLEMADAVSRLILHQEKTEGRTLHESTTPIQDRTETHVEVQRLRRELDSVNQLLNVCKNASSRATPDRVHVLENITVGDGSQQFCVSTIGDLFKVKGATAGHGSFQFFGSIAPEPLQEIANMHKGRQASNTRERGAEVYSMSGSRGSPAS